MKLGAYTACLHDRSLPETLKILQEMAEATSSIVLTPRGLLSTMDRMKMS